MKRTVKRTVLFLTWPALLNLPALLSLLALLPMISLQACGPQAARYEVKLQLSEHCETRGAEHLCDSDASLQSMTDLFIEPDGDRILIVFQEQNYLSLNQNPLYAERHSRDEGQSSTCARQRTQILQIEQGCWEAQGSYEEQLTASGPDDSCGDLPGSETWRWVLSGDEKEGPK